MSLRILHMFPYAFQICRREWNHDDKHCQCSLKNCAGYRVAAHVVDDGDVDLAGVRAGGLLHPEAREEGQHDGLHHAQPQGFNAFTLLVKACTIFRL